MKHINKITALCLAFTLSAWSLGPLMANAEDATSTSSLNEENGGVTYVIGTGQSFPNHQENGDADENDHRGWGGGDSDRHDGGAVPNLENNNEENGPHGDGNGSRGSQFQHSQNWNHGQGQDNHDGNDSSTVSVDTYLERNGGGSCGTNDCSGNTPVIKVKWEMNGPFAALSGTDDSCAPGAQFDITGLEREDVHYSVCAIVMDNDGSDDIDSVTANITLPNCSEPASLMHGGHGNHPNHPNNVIALQRLSKEDGKNLFCRKIRLNNANLPSFNEDFFRTVINSTNRNDMYNEICGEGGELRNEDAFVYCADAVLENTDPAGDYIVEITAQDKWGVSASLQNTLEYLSAAAYLIDFDSIDYGQAKLNIEKKVFGDDNFGTSDKPTVKNIGNTPLYVGVTQDDMGFGKTDSNWNIRFGGRVGHNEAAWKNWEPNRHDPVWLDDALALDTDEQMDFSVIVKRFPGSGQDWRGDMVMSVKSALGDLSH